MYAELALEFHFKMQIKQISAEMFRFYSLQVKLNRCFFIKSSLIFNDLHVLSPHNQLNYHIAYFCLRLQNH